MEPTGLLFGAAVIAGSAYFFYRYGKKQLPSEEIDELALADIAAYFKSKTLRKGIDVPFIATKSFFDKERKLARMIPNPQPGYTAVILGIMNKDNNSTTLEKVIYTKNVDESIAKSLQDKGILVLS